MAATLVARRTPPPNRMYSVSEVAEVMGVSDEAVREWLRKGHIRGVKPSRTMQSRWRIPQAELDRLQGG